MNRIIRRDFVRRAIAGAGTIIAGTGGSWALAAPTNGAKDWVLPILGDLHFDRLDHHDMDWLKKEHPNDVTQVQSYSRISREMTPKLLTVVRQQIKDAPAEVPFVLQLGDLVEGLCGSEERATQQANDALDLLRKIDFATPFLFTKGNHDITGPGAAQVYDKILVPFMAQNDPRGIGGAAFTRDQADSLLVFYDAYHRDSLEWFANVLEKQKPKRVVFVIHPPVVPYNARSTCHIYSQPRQERERQRLLEMLGRSRAIVLCGHLHKYCFLIRRTETGRFVQIGLSSVANSEDAKLRDLIEGVQGYGPDLVKLEPRHSPDTEERRRQILAAEHPFIEQYEYADTWGHAMLRVNKGQMDISIFRGFETKAWKTHDLTQSIR